MPRHTEFPPSLSPFEIGDPRRIGPYRIVGRLGAGGMGAVYGAIDKNGRSLAVKLVHREFADNDEFRARFAREVRLVQQVDARCTPAFAGADPDADTPWLATEYVPGPTLREHVTASGPMPEGMVRALAAGLAEALHAIHDAGIVHRDLKPSNVILAPGVPKVLDFGIARALDGTGITRTGGLMGSPGWIAPERYHGAEASPAADIFAWGGLVAFAATGRAPFGSGTPQAVAARTMQGQVDLTGLPAELVDLVTRALSTSPSQRPECIAILRELSETQGAETHAPLEHATLVGTLITKDWSPLPPSPPEDWTSLVPRRRSWLNVWTVGVAALALALVAYAWHAINPTTGLAGITEAISGDLSDEDENAPPQTTEESTLPLGSSAHNPGVFEHSFDGGSISVEMTGVNTTTDGIEFTGRAVFVSGSGSLEFGTNFYTPHDYEQAVDPSRNMELQVWPTPGEIFGVLSSDHAEITFTLVVPDENTPDPGALYFNTDSDEHDPHLCYRSEPYAETGTQFLHNEGDSWRDCALDPYE